MVHLCASFVVALKRSVAAAGSLLAACAFLAPNGNELQDELVGLGETRRT